MELLKNYKRLTELLRNTSPRRGPGLSVKMASSILLTICSEKPLPVRAMISRKIVGRILLICFFEACQQFIAALGGAVECLLRRLLAGPDVFQFFVDHGADLCVVAQTDTARFIGRLDDHLFHSDVGAGIALIETGLLGDFVSRLGHWQVAGFLMPLGLHFRLGRVSEELRHALVFVSLLAAHDPQRSAADDGVLRCALDVAVVRQRCYAK